MEHAPWIPADFANKPQRLLITGHSHHKLAEEEDSDDYTVSSVRSAIDGKMQIHPFFARQPKYLDMERKDYFNHVALINYIPTALDHRYAKPQDHMLLLAKERFLRIMSEHKPTHVFVLSKRLRFGVELPETVEQKKGMPLTSLIPDFGFTWGTYDVDGSIIRCCRLRHPQGARTSVMQDAFGKMLAL